MGHEPTWGRRASGDRPVPRPGADLTGLLDATSAAGRTKLLCCRRLKGYLAGTPGFWRRLTAMRSRFEGLTFRCTAAMMSGLLALTTVGPALAQGKPAKPVAAPAKPAKPAGQPAKPAAKPAKDATAKPKLTDKQKKDEAKKAYKAGEDKFG